MTDKTGEPDCKRLLVVCRRADKLLMHRGLKCTRFAEIPFEINVEHQTTNLGKGDTNLAHFVSDLILHGSSPA
jgi:hypothetical protein